MGNINYPVGDFLIRVKNAALARGHQIIVPGTKSIERVAKCMEKMGYLGEVVKKDKEISAKLAYRAKEPVLINLKLVSKPGLRVYMSVDELSKIKRPSQFIISTSKGIVTTKEAKKLSVGGEVIAEIW